MRVVNIDEISRRVVRDVGEVINRAERYYIEELESVADSISKLNIKIVLISGPSSAGKTTTSFKLQEELKKRNIASHVLNMDDFFIDMDKLPLREDGKPDIENICALDVKTIRKCLGEIIEKNMTRTPQFDFVTHTRLPIWVDCKLTGNEVIIMEGIHAHNPSIVEGLDRERIYKIYLDCETKFCVDNDFDDENTYSNNFENESCKTDGLNCNGASTLKTNYVNLELSDKTTKSKKLDAKNIYQNKNAEILKGFNKNGDFEIHSDFYGETLLSSREIRLLRRMIRDARDRDVPYLESIEMWKEVCRGEDRNILPYKSSADCIIDTVHDYELLVFSFVVEEKFKKFSQNETIAKYLSIFKNCGKIDEDLVPMDSLLREFIGPNNIDDRKN